MSNVQNIAVTPEESGQKLLQFLERRLGRDIPKSAIMKWIRKGEVRVDKGRKKPFDRVEAGQIVRVPPFHPGEPVQAPRAGKSTQSDESGRPKRLKEIKPRTPLKIAYEDDEILVVAKPSGLASHGGDKITDSVAERLQEMFKGASFTPSLCHRLDRDTSGLLLAAKTYESLRTLNQLFAEGKVGKVYIAWVRGRWEEPGALVLHDTMEKQGEPGKQKVRIGSGKEALAEVTGLESRKHISLLAVRLITGRTHQIRVQLSERGHSIFGDTKYGTETDRPPLRLHCYALQLPDRTLVLRPPWNAKWRPEPHHLDAALALLED